MYNIEQDPREEFEIGPEASWIVGKYMPLVGQYYASLKEHPNPRPANITDFRERYAEELSEHFAKQTKQAEELLNTDQKPASKQKPNPATKSEETT